MTAAYVADGYRPAAGERIYRLRCARAPCPHTFRLALSRGDPRHPLWFACPCCAAVQQPLGGLFGARGEDEEQG